MMGVALRQPEHEAQAIIGALQAHLYYRSQGCIEIRIRKKKRLFLIVGCTRGTELVTSCSPALGDFRPERGEYYV